MESLKKLRFVVASLLVWFSISAFQAHVAYAQVSTYASTGPNLNVTAPIKKAALITDYWASCEGLGPTSPYPPALTAAGTLNGKPWYKLIFPNSYVAGSSGVVYSASNLGLADAASTLTVSASGLPAGLTCYSGFVMYQGTASAVQGYALTQVFGKWYMPSSGITVQQFSNAGTTPSLSLAAPATGFYSPYDYTAGCSLATATSLPGPNLVIDYTIGGKAFRSRVGAAFNGPYGWTWNLRQFPYGALDLGSTMNVTTDSAVPSGSYCTTNVKIAVGTLQSPLQRLYLDIRYGIPTDVVPTVTQYNFSGAPTQTIPTSSTGWTLLSDVNYNCVSSTTPTGPVPHIQMGNTWSGITTYSYIPGKLASTSYLWRSDEILAASPDSSISMTTPDGIIGSNFTCSGSATATTFATESQLQSAFRYGLEYRLGGSDDCW